ncbi:MAG: ABC transporter substrate-binding protein [Proteobacteria bacterium]|nr:ABC transporter substrate-binding protein [Pseudomonadota bacterium]
MVDHNRTQAVLRGLAFIFVVALPLGFATPSAADETEEKAGSFIRSLAAEAIRSLAEKDAPRDIRIQRFRKLFNDHFAVNSIGRFVLGGNWKKASKDEQKEYLVLFEDLMVVSYVDRFSRYAGENLEVTRTRAENGGSTTVFSQISRPTGKPVMVLWRVGSTDKTMKILDVIVEGASMSQTLRSDFGSIIRQQDGKVSGLIDALRLKTASLKASSK